MSDILYDGSDMHLLVTNIRDQVGNPIPSPSGNYTLEDALGNNIQPTQNLAASINPSELEATVPASLDLSGFIGVVIKAIIIITGSGLTAKYTRDVLVCRR